MKPIAYVDMDGVIADFAAGMKHAGVDDPKVFKLMAGAYMNLPLCFYAERLIDTLERKGFKVRILTKPPTDNVFAATEKLIWIKQQFPRLLEHVTITHDKGQVGSERDVLIDDRPHKANCENFRGTFYHWVDNPDWDNFNKVLDGHLRNLNETC